MSKSTSEERLEMALNLREAGQMIREIEDARTLLRHRLDGWCVWPLLRFPVAMLLCGGTYARPSVRSGFTRMELSRRALCDFWRLMRFGRRGCPIVVTCSSYKTDRDDDGRAEDCLFDEVCIRLGGVFKIEQINNRLLFERNANAVVPCDMSNAVFSSLSGMFITRVRPSTKVSEVAHALIADLHDIKELAPLTARHICNALTLFRRERMIWRTILTRVRPPYVLLESGYCQHSLIAASRECQVPSVELQHGCFFEDGPEYCWTTIGVGFRDSMPVPDRLFLFGDFWKRILDRDQFWQDRVRVVGSTRIDKYRRLRRLQTEVSRANDVKTLLVTSQGICTKQLVEFVRETLWLSRDWEELRVCVKLHPACDGSKQSYVDLMPSDTRLLLLGGDEGPPTLLLLANADFHASISSTCHFEAVSLGVPTFVLPLPSHESMCGMIQSGMARLVQSPAEMLRLMRADLLCPAEIEAGNEYYAGNAAENIVRELSTASEH